MRDDYSVLVVGAAVVIVPVVEEMDSYDDLINSVLLAQLVANKRIEKNSQDRWYDVYVAVLDSYWLRRTKARQEWNIARHCLESMSDWVIAMISGSDPVGGQTASDILQRVAALPATDTAIALLRKRMQKPASDEPGHVPVSPETVRSLVLLARTPTSVSSVYIELTPHSPISPNPLAQRFQANDIEGLVCMRYADMYLSETLYGPARSAIASKVLDRREANIAMLALRDEVSVIQQLE